MSLAKDISEAMDNRRVVPSTQAKAKDGDMGEMAAKAFAKAVSSGNPKEIVSAFSALSSYCSMKEDDEDGDYE